MSSKYELTHARHSPIFCLAPELFRSWKRGQRKKEKLDLEYQFGEKVVKIRGFEPLGADDLRVLHGLIAEAGAHGLVIPSDTTNPIGRKIRTELALSGEAVSQDVLTVEFSAYKIMREIGLTDGGANFKTFQKCLERLDNVSVVCENGSSVKSYKLLKFEVDKKTGEAQVTLNTDISAAITGGRHTRISMEEIRQIKSDVALIIHQRLCGWINPGKERKVGVDILADYAWPVEAPTKSAKSNRRKKVREALAELANPEGAGWKVSEYKKNSFSIRRPETVIIVN